MEFMVKAILMGVIATVCMDIWAAIAKHVLRLPTANWSLVGRWFGHMRRGTFIHRPITDSAPISNEMVIGWIAHYVTGLIYGLIYLSIIQIFLQIDPTFKSALIFGLATLIAPWFIMQPAMGAGVFARHTPHPGLMRAVTISMHVVFGCSLFLGWLLIQ
jgi:hypothetical protein